MEESEKKEHLEMLREAGVKAGIVPVQNLFNEDQRIEEVKRLGILDLNLSSEPRYNSMTQVATYLTRLSSKYYQYPRFKCPTV